MLLVFFTMFTRDLNLDISNLSGLTMVSKNTGVCCKIAILYCYNESLFILRLNYIKQKMWQE